MNWQPIETYDALKKKPKLAAFYFVAEGTVRGRSGPRLFFTVQLTRNFGSRVCTHWCPLPDTDELDKG
jgi:hypothetical protein